MQEKSRLNFNTVTQIAMPVLTVVAQIAVSLKYPEYGVLINLIAQPFWLYSGWRSYKQAGQIGFFVNTIILTVVFGVGVVNYWLL